MATRDAFRWATGPGGAVMLLLLAAACGGRTREPSAAADPAAGGGGSPASQAGTGAPLQPIPAHAQAMPGGAPAGHEAMPGGASAGEVRWTAPKEWTEVTPSSQMRRAQYRLPAVSTDTEDGECVVYYFGAGQGGDAQANIQRWVAQFSGPGSESPLTTEIKVGDLTVRRVEVGGTYTPSPMSMMGGPAPQPKPGSILLGAIVPGPDSNWFFKCTGPEKTMKANRARFDALLGSLQVTH
jgi:hypothetical protein